MKVVRLPQALIDLVETAEYIAEDNIEAADLGGIVTAFSSQESKHSLDPRHY